MPDIYLPCLDKSKKNVFDFYIGDIKDVEKAQECVANFYFTNSEVKLPSEDYVIVAERLFAELLVHVTLLEERKKSDFQLWHSNYEFVFEKKDSEIDVYYGERYKNVTVLKCGVEVEERVKKSAVMKLFYHGNFDEFVKHLYGLALKLQNEMDKSGSKLRSINGFSWAMPMYEDFMDARAGKPKRRRPKKNKEVKLTREEKLQIKEKEKQYEALYKQIGRSHKMKCRSGTLYYVNDGFIIDIYCSFWGKSNTVMYSAGKKRLDYDNILWDILGMESNKKESVSLHAVGAFTVGGLVLLENNFAALGDKPEVCHIHLSEAV